MILLCMGAGYYLGKKLGHLKPGLFVGWIIGMCCVAYEIWKINIQNRTVRTLKPENTPKVDKSHE